MKLSGPAADKLTFAGIYLVAGILLVWGAARFVNYAVDAGFYRDYLMPWELRLLEMRYMSVQWPLYRKENPVGYMQKVVGVIHAKGKKVPSSNTRHDFIYRLQRFGGGTHQILLVFHDNTLDIYGLPKDTFDRLDRYIDGNADPVRGEFTGRWSSDRVTMIGRWKI